MLLGKFSDAGRDFLPRFVTGNRTQQRGRNLNPEIKRARMTDVDDDRSGAAIPGEKMRDIFNRLLCGREADADWRAIG